MKALVLLLVIAGIVAAAFFGFKKVQSSSSVSPKTLEVTLTGTLTAVTQTSEYSFLLKTQSQSVGINSMKVKLEPFANKKVTVMGQYSGSVLYADTVTEIQ